MPRPLLCCRLLVLCACIFGLALASGCGSGTYKKRMNESIEVLEVQSPFLRTLANEPVKVYNNAGYGVELRKPNIFSDPEHTAHMGAGLQHRDGSLKTYAGRPVEQTAYTPPGFLPSDREHGTWITTWQTFEFLFVDPTDKAFPAYAYFAFVPENEASTEEVQKQVLTKLEAQFPNADLAWEEIEVDGPEGETSPWFHVSVTGDMPFDVRFWDFRNSNFYQPTEALTTYSARMDFYLQHLEQPLMQDDQPAESEEDEPATRPFTAIIGFRAPDEIAGTFKVFQGGDAAMGTIAVAPQVEDQTPAGSATEPGQQEAEQHDQEQQTIPGGPNLNPRGSRPRRPTTPPADDQTSQDQAPTSTPQQELAADVEPGAKPDDFRAPADDAGSGVEPPAAAVADGPFALRWNFAERDQFYVTLSHESTGTVSREDEVRGQQYSVEMDLNWQVQSISGGDDDSKYLVELTVQDMDFLFQLSDEEGYFPDSTSGEAMALSDEALNSVYALIGQKLELTMNNRGVIENITFPASFTTKLGAARQLTKVNFFSARGIENVLAATLMNFPERTMQKGLEWSFASTCDAWPLGAQSELNYIFADNDFDTLNAPAARLETNSVEDLQLQDPQQAGSGFPPGAEVALTASSSAGVGYFDIGQGLLVKNRLTQTYGFTVTNRGSESHCTVVWTAEISLSRSR